MSNVCRRGWYLTHNTLFVLRIVCISTPRTNPFILIRLRFILVNFLDLRCILELKDTVSSSINKLTGAYGGSEKSSASFLRKQHVKYNSLSKAKDFGRVVNLNTTVSGDVGGEVGAYTLYFKVTTDGESDLRVTKHSIQKYKDQYISIGLLDGNGKQIQRNISYMVLQK